MFSVHENIKRERVPIAVFIRSGFQWIFTFDLTDWSGCLFFRWWPFPGEFIVAAAETVGDPKVVLSFIFFCAIASSCLRVKEPLLSGALLVKCERECACVPVTPSAQPLAMPAQPCLLATAFSRKRLAVQVTPCRLWMGHSHATHAYLLRGTEQPRHSRCGGWLSVIHVY